MKAARKNNLWRPKIWKLDILALYNPEVHTRVLLHLIIYSNSPTHYTYLSAVLIAEMQLAVGAEEEERNTTQEVILSSNH